MRAISLRTIVAALALLILPPLAAETFAQQSAGATGAANPILAATGDLDGLEADADPECESGARHRGVRSRNPGPLSWLFRFDRGGDDRSDRPFAFYLRSPLLSGLYRCPPNVPSGAHPPEPVDECAELTITTSAFVEQKIQVLLPQLDARNARRLRSHIEQQLKRDVAVTLIMTGGEPFSLVPDDVRDVEARACRRGAWH